MYFGVGLLLCLFITCLSEIIWYLTFSVSLTLLSIILSKFMQVAGKKKDSILYRLSSIPLYTISSLSVLLFHGHLGYIHILAIINDAMTAVFSNLN